MIEPRCLINEEGRAPLFQGSFVGHGKWFRGPLGASGREEVRSPAGRVAAAGETRAS
jgi:hypothetical protein